MGYDVQTSSVFATIFINLVTGAAFLLGFEFLRKNKDIFAPKPKWNTNPRVPNLEPADGLFAWIPQVMAIYDEDIIAISGMDAYVMIRYIRMCFMACCWCSFFAGVILLPVYFTAPDNFAAGINLYSMAHIDTGSSRLWVPVAFTYLFVGIFLYFLHTEYENFAERRKIFFSNGDPRLPTQMLYTVQVENIPPDFRSSGKLKELFEELFPNEVHCAAVMMNLPELDEALEKRDNACARLEAAIAAKEASKDHEDPLLTTIDGEPTMLSCCRPCLNLCYTTEQIDAIRHWRNELDTMNTVVSELQKQALRVAEGDRALDELKLFQKFKKEKEQKKKKKQNSDANHESKRDSWHVDENNTEFKVFFNHKSVSKTGLVTFKSRRCQVTAVGMPIVNGKFPYMTVTAAPSPTDIIWENVTVDTIEIQKIRTIVTVILTAGFLFWGVVLATVAAISSLSNLQKLLPFLKSLNTSTKAILSGQLPVITLMLFVNNLPIILQYFVQNIAKRKTISEVQSEVFSWFFKYQIANVFLILITGSLFNALQQILDNPILLFSILGSSLPQVSIFFMNYVITQLLSGVPSMLFNYVGYIIYFLYKLVFGESKLTRRILVEGPLSKNSVDYGQELPSILYTMYVVFIYWTIAPIVLLIGTLYCGALLLAWKYQLIFVMVPNYEGGGRFWYNLYRYTMIGLMASVVTMVGYLSIKEGGPQVPVLVPLIPIIYYAWGYTEREFQVLSQFLPYSDAVAVDSRPHHHHHHHHHHPHEHQHSGEHDRPVTPITPITANTTAAVVGSNNLEGSNKNDVISSKCDANSSRRGGGDVSVGSLVTADHVEIELGGGDIGGGAGAEHKYSKLPSDADHDDHQSQSQRPSSSPSLVGTSNNNSNNKDGTLGSMSSLQVFSHRFSSMLTHGTKLNTIHEAKSPPLNAASFSDTYCYQKSVTTANPITPYPYRVRGVPLLDERGQMNIMYYSEDPESFGKEPIEEDYDVESGLPSSAAAAAGAAGVGGAVVTNENALVYPPGALDLTRDSNGDMGGIALVTLGSQAQQQQQQKTRGKAQRRRSTFQEIQQAARRESFSDKEDDDEEEEEADLVHGDNNRSNASLHSSSSESVLYEDLSKKVHVIGLAAFRRREPYPTNEAKPLPKPKKNKKKKSQNAFSSTSAATTATAVAATSSSTRGNLQSYRTSGKAKKRGSTIMDIENFIASDTHHKETFSDEEGDEDMETEDENSIHRGSSRRIAAGAAPATGISMSVSSSLMSSLFPSVPTDASVPSKSAPSTPTFERDSTSHPPQPRQSFVGSLFGSLLTRRPSNTSLDSNGSAGSISKEQSASKSLMPQEQVLAALGADDVDDTPNVSSAATLAEAAVPNDSNRNPNLQSVRSANDEDEGDDSDESRSNKASTTTSEDEPTPAVKTGTSPRPSIFGAFRFSLSHAAPAPAHAAASVPVHQQSLNDRIVDDDEPEHDPSLLLEVAGAAAAASSSTEDKQGMDRMQSTVNMMANTASDAAEAMIETAASAPKVVHDTLSAVSAAAAETPAAVSDAVSGAVSDAVATLTDSVAPTAAHAVNSAVTGTVDVVSSGVNSVNETVSSAATVPVNTVRGALGRVSMFFGSHPSSGTNASAGTNGNSH